MPSPDRVPESEWTTAVEVRADPALAHTLVERLPPPGAGRDVSVTELVAGRPAYWRAVSPVPVAPEREARRETGRLLHRAIELALAPCGRLEARVRRDGIAGRIDLLADVPVEIKTTAGPSASDALEQRPAQIEQLAMYAALADQRVGRLLTVQLATGDPGRVEILNVGFGEPTTARAEMVRRAEVLRSAWRAHDPSSLPRCPWFDRGCEFRTEGVCDCRGTEPEVPSSLLTRARTLPESPDLAEDWRARIRANPHAERGAPPLGRFRDLIYPRRAYFESVLPPEPGVPEGSDPAAPPDLYARVRSAVESGPAGEVSLVPLPTGGPGEDVLGFRGDPYLLRTHRGWEPPDAASLVMRQPQYALELGLRAVATGRSAGRLILGWERASSLEEQVWVALLRFPSPTVFSRLWRTRQRQLEEALRHRAPESLPACPEWRYRSCPYAPGCACAPEADRSHR